MAPRLAACLGALVDLGLPEEEARHFERGFRGGATLVSVEAADRVMDALAILERHDADTSPGTVGHSTRVVGANSHPAPATGMFAGATAGAVAGTVAAGPIGTVLGGVAGAAAGAAVGQAVSTDAGDDPAMTAAGTLAGGLSAAAGAPSMAAAGAASSPAVDDEEPPVKT